MTYRWNEGATDAEVVLEDTVVDLSVIDENGSETEQRYLLPGPDACMTCHLPEAGSVLGVRTTQLHSAQTDEALAEDQVLQLSGLGIFDREFTGEEVLELPSLAPLRDERRSVEERIRSYLDSNCSMCHGYRADLLPRFDARFTTPLEEQRIVGAETVAQRMGPGSLVVAPGQVEQSDLFVRDSSTTRGVRMPPVGRSLVDDEYLALLKVWIESLRGDPRFE